MLVGDERRLTGSCQTSAKESTIHACRAIKAVFETNNPGMVAPIPFVLQGGRHSPDQLFGSREPAVAIPKEFRSHRQTPRSPNFPSSEQCCPSPE